MFYRAQLFWFQKSGVTSNLLYQLELSFILWDRITFKNPDFSIKHDIQRLLRP